jgi:hypothetical protein
MAETLTPPPPGFELDEEFPPPPEGFELDSTPSLSESNRTPIPILGDSARRVPDMQATTRGGAPLSLPEGALRSTLGEIAGGITEPQEGVPFSEMLPKFGPRELLKSMSAFPPGIGLPNYPQPTESELKRAEKSKPLQLMAGGTAGTGELIAGIGQFLTSRQGQVELGLTETPLAPAVALKWAKDMVEGGMINGNEAYDAFKRGDMGAFGKHVVIGTGLLLGAGGMVKHGVTKAGAMAEGYAPRGTGIEPARMPAPPNGFELDETPKPTEVANARSQPIPESVSQSEIRPSVGQETRVRQPGETPGAQAAGETAKGAEGALPLTESKAPEVKSESTIEAMPVEDQAKLSHGDGIAFGVTQTESAVPHLQEKYNAANQEMVKAFQSGNAKDQLAAFGKMNYYGGALMGATRGKHPISGSNYELYVKKYGEPPSPNAPSVSKSETKVDSTPTSAAIRDLDTGEMWSGEPLHGLLHEKIPNRNTRRLEAGFANNKGEFITQKQAETETGLSSGEELFEMTPAERRNYFEIQRKQVKEDNSLTPNQKSSRIKEISENEKKSDKWNTVSANAPAESGPMVESDSVAGILERYDSNDETISTPRDVADAVQELIDAGKAPASLKNHIDRLRKEIKDSREFGFRMDMEGEAADVMMAAFEKYAASEKPNSVPNAPKEPSPTPIVGETPVPAAKPVAEKPAKKPRAPTILQELDPLVINYGLETGRIEDLESLHSPKITETSGLGSMGLAAKRKYSKEITAARERIASDLGISKDKLKTPEGRSEFLATLKARIAERAKPKGGELDLDIPLTLTGEKAKFVEPTKETTAFGEERLSQNDLFNIEEVTREVDPFKSADAAERMYGEEAVSKIENQLRVMDKDPEVRKSFTKQQRQRLNEVLNVLRQRLEKEPPENVVLEGDPFQTAKKSDPFERARAGDDKAFDDLDNQFRETYPDPSELESRPSRDQVHTPQAFAAKFNAAFAARDFDTILDTIKATSDVSIWKPFLQDLFKRQAKDPVAAEKAEWMRHVFNGTRPASSIPRPPPKPSAPHRPPPPVTPTPRPKAGAAPPPRSPPTPPSPPPVRIPVDPIPGGGGKSPYRIIEDFSTAIGKAIRVLRMKKNGLGVYRPGSTLTAERFAGDLDTAAHELAGHWTDDKYGIGKPWVAAKTRSPYDTELAKFWIHGSVTPRSTLRYRRAEGIAEFIRAYVVNPKQAKLDAPNFSAYFERTLPPEALKAINDFGTDVRRWAGEEPLVRAGLNIRMEPPTLTERLWKGLHGRGFGFEINPMDRLRLWFDDPYHYAVKAFHQISELKGTSPKPTENFELLSRLLSTHDSRMSDQFERGLVPLRPGQTTGPKGALEVDRLIDPVTKEPMTMKWLLGAFDRANKDVFNQDMRDASAYMVAQRTIEKGKQLGKERVSGIGAGIMSDKQAAQELLNRVAADPARKTRLDEAARRYRLWADQNLNMLVDAGRMSKSAAAEIRKNNQQYVDMHRLSEEFESGFRSQRGGGIGTTRDVIKRFKGSTLELDNVYSNLLEQTDAIQKEAHRNVVMRSFVDGLAQVRELHGPNLKDFDQFGRKVTSADRNTIKVFKDGKAENWQFDPEIYESLKGLGELGSHAFIDLLALPSRLARYMITHGPQFIVRNPLRDTMERTVTSRSGSKPWDILQGYSQAELSRYEVFGGGQFGNYIVDRHVWNRELKRTMRELTKDPANIFLSPLKLKRAWESLAEKSEKLGRVAEYRRAFERGKKEFGYDDYNAALYAAGEARGLLDFAKAGTVMRDINKLVPFSNARVRGLARAAFGFRENPGRFAMRWGLFVLAPTIATMLWNRQDKETWEEYQQLPAYQKDFFWNFKVGPYWIRIPKPHELGVMAGGVERAVSRMLGDKNAMEGLAGSATSAAAPISTPVEGTGPLKTMLELEFNRDTFRNRDIIPAWERDLKLDLRKGTKFASGAGRGIADALNVTGLTIDPRQVDYVLGSYGGLGQIATGTTGKNRGLQDAAIKATGLTSDPAGTAARDVQWVIDWAKKNGKLNDAKIEQLQALRKRVLEEKDAGLRDVKSAELRKYATRLRDYISSVGK